MNGKDDARSLFSLRTELVEEVSSHARESLPFECCGLIGGDDQDAKSVYRLRNIAANRLTNYEAAPQDLFTAQRLMRERGETLLAIYHSHPRELAPAPSETDVRCAFYPSAVYLIVGFADGEPVLRAFRIYERERRWEEVALHSNDGAVWSDGTCAADGS